MKNLKLLPAIVALAFFWACDNNGHNDADDNDKDTIIIREEQPAQTDEPKSESNMEVEYDSDSGVNLKIEKRNRDE